MVSFRYFLGPSSEMLHLAPSTVECAFCSKVGDGFDLDAAIRVAHDERKNSSMFGCPECLLAGRFGFAHNTDVGTLGEAGLRREYPNHRAAPPAFRPDAVETLRRTPDVLRWQYEPWLTHCDDFMAYVGTWRPSDFVRNAPNGYGRSLFLRMTREPDLRHVWDAECPAGATVPPDSWHPVYYAYRCLHCGELAGNWDCD
jgi:uncharacterized protein CbrC (UPF0167 family)